MIHEHGEWALDFRFMKHGPLSLTYLEVRHQDTCSQQPPSSQFPTTEHGPPSARAPVH
jgi:hypothetical protein